MTHQNDALRLPVRLTDEEPQIEPPISEGQRIGSHARKVIIHSAIKAIFTVAMLMSMLVWAKTVLSNVIAKGKLSAPHS